MGGMDRHIVIRENEPADKEAVLSLIRANHAEYFAPEEEADLSRYLDCEREWFYVLLFDGKIVGCGGINLADERTTGKISWDILHPEYQGRSLGTRLLGFPDRKARVARRHPEDHGQNPRNWLSDSTGSRASCSRR